MSSLRTNVHLFLGLLLAASGATLTALSVGGPAGATTPTPTCVSTHEPLGAATGWTEFIEGSGSRGSESEGSIAWGGNLNASGMTVGTRLSSAAHEATLVVAGTHGGFNLQKGSAYLDPASGVNFNGGGHYLASNPIDFAAAFTALRARSTQLATATANGTAALGVVGGQNYLVLTGTDPSLNVFSLTPAQLTSGAGIAYNVPQGAGVLVNVSGAAVTLQGQMSIKHNGSYTQVNDNVMQSWPEILWNFPQATTVTMSFGSAWGGSLLAPNAFLNVTSVGHTIGQVIAKTFSSNYETHQRLYPSSPCLPPVPSAENPSISLDKTASSINDLDGNGPDAGDTIGYTFVVTNTGDVALDPVTVTDPMFPGLTCPSGALAPGASVTCTPQTHTLTGADVAAGAVDNTAVAEGTSPGGTEVDDDDSTHTPVVPTVAPANIKVTKVVDDTTPAAGQVVTYTLQVSNPGASAADNVVLSDVLPSGVTFVSAAAPCTLAGTTVTCGFGTLAAGATRTVTIKATVVAPPAVPSHEHQIDIQKTEAHVDLDPGQSRTVSVSCAPGYLVTDGSGRIDHVDQGTGTLDQIHMTTSHAVGSTGWEVTMVNHAAGRAQGKVFAVCARQQTETVDGHSHDLVIGAPVTETRVLPAGRTDVTLSCGPGRTPVTPGYVLDGVAPVVTSYPSGTTGWTFSVVRDDATTGTFEIRCLDRTVNDVDGHVHDLSLVPVTQTVTVAPGQTAEVTLTCADGSKGIVAGHDVDAPLYDLGNDPRPIIRVFKLYNPTAAPLDARLWLLCLGLRTASASGGEPVVNIASVTTTSTETTTADNSASASFTVTSGGSGLSLRAPAVRVSGATPSAAVTCATGSAYCTGTMRLVATRRMVVHGLVVRRGTVLARTTYRVADGAGATVRLRPTAIGAKALRSPRLTRAKLFAGGSATYVRVRR